VAPLRNVAERPRERFLVDPAAHLALSRRLRAESGRIVAAFHSHVDGPARLSDEDLREALADGEPVLPGVDLIVVGVRSGIIQEIRVFGWGPSGFVEVDGMA
jgi:proteasome lid subunit RPN8/RPN11